jgi:flagellar protein FliS
MDTTARDAYLETQLLTAPPQKLRLVLIEGAIRYARKTLEHWDSQQNEDACESLIRCREIVSELLSSVKIDESSLARRVAGVYTFLFQTLTEAQLRRDRQKLQEAVAVLEVERETWQQVCEQTVAAPNGGSHQKLPAVALSEAPYTGGFSLEA